MRRNFAKISEQSAPFTTDSFASAVRFSHTRNGAISSREHLITTRNGAKLYSLSLSLPPFSVYLSIFLSLIASGQSVQFRNKNGLFLAFYCYVTSCRRLKRFSRTWTNYDRAEITVISVKNALCIPLSQEKFSDDLDATFVIHERTELMC